MIHIVSRKVDKLFFGPDVPGCFEDLTEQSSKNSSDMHGLADITEVARFWHFSFANFKTYDFDKIIGVGCPH